jgi:peptidoglycan/LPS O-acetylase OafA/YrhL
MWVARLGVLDGLRGWGAVFVLLYHLFCDALPLGPSATTLQYFLPFNGQLAVQVFFVVSGFALSVRYLSDGDLQAWSRILAGRYIRLAIPILAACFIVHVVMALNLVAPPSERLPVFRPYFNFEPTIGHLLRFSLFDVFFDYKGSETYIGPLWTMSIELIGSFIVLLAILVVRRVPARILMLCGVAVMILVLAPSKNAAMLALFPLGAALADCFNRGWLDDVPTPISVLILVVAASVPLMTSSKMAWGLLSAVPLTFGAIAFAPARVWLSGRLSAWLGRLSFPLYLIHGPIICFVGEPMMRAADTGIEKVGVQLLVLLLSFCAARAFVPVNDLAVRLAHRFANLVVGPAFAFGRAI